MSQTRARKGPHRVRRVLFMALPIAIVSTGWLESNNDSTTPAKSPAPNFNPEKVLTVDLRTIRAYASALHFDSVLGAADSQLVDFTFPQGQVTSTGSPSRIEPEMGAAYLTRDQLADGRIVARVRSQTVFAAQGIGPWWSYLWVDQRGPGRSWRSVLIPSEGLPTRVVSGLLLHQHPGGYPPTCPEGRSCARFTSDGPCYVCGNRWCTGPKWRLTNK
jgi:hypothetical protein